MSSLTSYITFWMIFFVLLGAFWYVIDRRFGVKWYRVWFNLTHKDPLPSDVEAGFIYNRKTRNKVMMATLLSTLQTVAALFSLETINLLVELILWIVEVPMTMVEFLIGPWAYRLWRGRNEMYDALDEINAKSEKTASADVVSEPKKEVVESEEPAEKPEEKETTEPAKDDDSDDPRDMMRRYTDKH